MSKVFLYAPNINKGGGFVLLKSIIDEWPRKTHLFAYLDFRIKDKIKIPENSTVHWVKPSIYHRLKAEYMIARDCLEGDTVLFKNSLPPIFKCKAKVVVFMQNRNFIENIKLFDYKFFDAFRLSLERAQSFIFRHRVDLYIVQTNSFKRKIDNWYTSHFLSKKPAIKVLPFMNESFHNLSTHFNKVKKKKWDFIYVADGLAQKNHSVLFDAWEELAKQHHFPSLLVTLSSHETVLLERINELKKVGVIIKNIGEIPHEDIISIYEECRALIYPSLRESFGLPLLEATALQLPILASELDYVYDVCNPIISFNPKSYLSISRAVKRFIKIENRITKVHTPSEFLGYVIDELENT